MSLGNWFCMSRKGGTGGGGLVHCVCVCMWVWWVGGEGVVMANMQLQVSKSYLIKIGVRSSLCSSATTEHSESTLNKQEVTQTVNYF